MPSAAANGTTGATREFLGYFDTVLSVLPILFDDESVFFAKNLVEREKVATFAPQFGNGEHVRLLSSTE